MAGATEPGSSRRRLPRPQTERLDLVSADFLAPIEENEPGLEAIDAVVEQAERNGIPSDKHVLLGFSQGACLPLEYVARNPRRCGGVVAFTGGLIEPPDTNRDYPALDRMGASVEASVSHETLIQRMYG